jgi:DNA replication licensing factor MCM3
MVKHYTDESNLAAMAEDAFKPSEGNNTMPTKDANDNPLSCEYGYCLYKDS